MEQPEENKIQTQVKIEQQKETTKM